MRLRNLAALATVLMLVPALAGAAPITKFNQSLPFSDTVPGICFEDVNATGGIHFLGSTTSSPGGAFRCSFHFNLQNVTGFGAISGDDYTVDSSGNISVGGNLRNNTNRFHATFNGTLTDLDTGALQTIQVVVQFTVNAKGDLTASIISITVLCSS